MAIRCEECHREANGTHLKVLPLKLRADSAAWSPSGARIVYRCAGRVLTGTFRLCTSRLDGKRLKQFPYKLDSAHPSWGTHP